jgi:transglutaminase-like putative cysteine protease
VFTLPDVQVGSILEYRYVLGYESTWVVSPRWYLREPLYVRKAHFTFVPSDHAVMDAHDHSIQGGRYAYAAYLPPGDKVVYSPAGKLYTIDVDNIPALPEEEFMPPMHNYTYRALFFYTTARTTEEFWSEEGKYWSKSVDKFMDVGKLTPVVNQIVTPADSSALKLQKIYNAVMKLENTSFTREHSAVENKATGARDKNAFDIWQQQRGNRDELTRLFVGLARAAGFKAYVAEVTNRDVNLFVPDYLDMQQLDDDIAIVEVDGKEQYFDPGQRYAEFGQLHWKHTATSGLRQTANGTAIFTMPTPGYQSSTEVRQANLEIEPDGKIRGDIRFIFTGTGALRWREFALRNDEEALKQELEQTVQRQMPAGIEVKADHLLGLTDWQTNFQCVFKVSGSMGTATSKRVFLPAMFFAGTEPALFTLDKREMPVDLRYAYALRDLVTIKLPPALQVESLPKDAEIVFPQMALYKAKFGKNGNEITSERTMVLGNPIYRAEEYPQLKDFYQKVNAKDKETEVLGFAQSASLAPPDGKTR